MAGLWDGWRVIGGVHLRGGFLHSTRRIWLQEWATADYGPERGRGKAPAVRDAHVRTRGGAGTNIGGINGWSEQFGDGRQFILECSERGGKDAVPHIVQLDGIRKPEPVGSELYPGPVLGVSAEAGRPWRCLILDRSGAFPGAADRNRSVSRKRRVLDLFTGDGREPA